MKCRVQHATNELNGLALGRNVERNSIIAFAPTEALSPPPTCDSINNGEF